MVSGANEDMFWVGHADVDLGIESTATEVLEVLETLDSGELAASEVLEAGMAIAVIGVLDVQNEFK